MAINKLGDPLPKMDTIHAWLSELYDQVRKQTITAGVPAHQNCEQQEKEIIQHFKEIGMTSDMMSTAFWRVWTTPITCSPQMSCMSRVPQRRTIKRLRKWIIWMKMIQKRSQCYNKIPMPIQSLKMMVLPQCKKALTEIREATASVTISSDWDYRKLVGLSLEQSTAAMDAGGKVVEKIQTDNFEPDVETELTYLHSQRSERMR